MISDLQHFPACFLSFIMNCFSLCRAILCMKRHLAFLASGQEITIWPCVLVSVTTKPPPHTHILCYEIPTTACWSNLIPGPNTGWSIYFKPSFSWLLLWFHYGLHGEEEASRQQRKNKAPPWKGVVFINSLTGFSWHLGKRLSLVFTYVRTPLVTKINT